MKDIFIDTLKKLHPDNWETIYAEVEDSKRLLQRLIHLMQQCMSADDYALFSLYEKAANDLIDEEIAKVEFEDYLDKHDDDGLADFDIVCDRLPLSRFDINFQKFIALVIERYGWVFLHSLDGEKSNSVIIPDSNRDCDSYVRGIVFEIHWRWESIKSSIVLKQRKAIISEAHAILHRKWEDISVADYDKAIELLRSIEAYPELINVLREWTYIRGENGWKVKRSDIIEALRLEEKATYEGDNVTLQDWANLYEYDSDSSFKPENTKAETLKAFYNQGSGLAALILGDLHFETALWPIQTGFLYDVITTEIKPELVEIMANELKDALGYYEMAGIRGYAIGYLAQSLVYRVLGQNEIAEKLEMEYKNEPYANKRASYNLLRDYKRTSEYEDRTISISNDSEDEDEPMYKWLTPLPLSLMALDKDEALKYLDRIFNDIKLELRGHQ